MDRPALDAWRALADRWKLRLDPSAWGSWRGVVDGVPIALEVVSGALPDGTSGVRMTARTPRAGLHMMAAGDALGDDGARRTGDPAFDDQVLLADDDWRAQALLDLETRAVLADLVARRGLVARAGTLVLEPRAAAGIASSEVRAVAGFVLTVARKLAAATDDKVVQVALRSFLTDPIPGVREALVELAARAPALADALAREPMPAGPIDDQAFERLAGMATDRALGKSQRVQILRQLVAAVPPTRWKTTVLGSEPAVLDELFLAFAMLEPTTAADALVVAEVLAGVLARALAGVGSATPDDDRARRALEAILRLEAPGDELLDVLGPTARSYALERAPSVAQPAARSRGHLLAALSPGTEPHPVLGPAYVKALGRVGDARHAAALEPALRSPYVGITDAAIDALARIGTLAQVPALMPYTEGLFRSGKTKERAHAAIEQIRERHRAFSAPGALTLAEVGAGALALTDADRDGRAGSTVSDGRASQASAPSPGGDRDGGPTGSAPRRGR